MPKTVLIDELQITVKGPAKLSPEQIDAIRQVLLSKRFTAEITRVVRTVFQRQRALEPLKVRLSR